MSARNKVSIIYQPLEAHPKVTINNEEISRYMELSDYIHDDILSWVQKLYEGMDNEINDEYDIEICGHKFHYLVVKSFQATSSFCKDVRFKEIASPISIKDKFAFVCKMAKELSAQDAPYIDINCISPEKYEKYGIKSTTFNKTQSKYFLCAEGDDISTVRNKYIVMLSDKMTCSSQGESIIIRIPENELLTALEYFNLYHIQLSYIKVILDMLNDKRNNLTALQSAETEAYLQEKTVIYVEDVPSAMEYGEAHNLIYHVFPSCFPAPKLSVEISDPGVARFENGKIYAQNRGQADIIIFDNDKREHYRKKISVSRHTYIENITIIAPVTEMQINETATFRCVFTPANADDVNDVKYIVSNENIIVISSRDEIFAVGDGRATLTVTAKNFSKSVEFQVIPKLKDITIYPQSLDMKAGTLAELRCSLVPSNVTPQPSVTWKTSDNDLVRIAEASGLSCKLSCYGVAPYPVTVTCSVADTDISKTVAVTIPQKRGCLKACYIATVVYGSYDCPEVYVLRRFRDQTLEKTWYGRGFIAFYYFTSPIAVTLFGKTKWFNRLWENRLSKFVGKLKASGYDDSAYTDR
ncbi:MAG: Ig-like domain-containing protein [Oscillospiraceae bacterium]|jgi:ACT domain-containing protein|nr:Ig-like domain-containing protein [Oscillospiraceae bacterium]